MILTAKEAGGSRKDPKQKRRRKGTHTKRRYKPKRKEKRDHGKG